MVRIPVLLSTLITFLLTAPAHHGADFDGIQCGSDIAKALVGRKMANRPVVEIEKAYQGIKLKNLGADDLENGFFDIVWEICGDKYLLLENRDTVVDVVKLPPLSETALPVSVRCKLNGKDIDDVLPVLKPGAKATEANVQQAWRIDFKKKKLVPLEGEGLICPSKT